MFLLLLACTPKKKAPETAAQQVASFQAPVAARSWYLKARVAEEKGDVAGADRAMAWVVRLDRGSPWSHLARGRYLDRQGRHDDAYAAYKAALAVDDIPTVRLALARSWLRYGDDRAAVEHLRAAGDSAEALELLARALIRLGHDESASKVLDRWLTVEGDVRARSRVALDLDRHDAAFADLWTLLSRSERLEDAEALYTSAISACRMGTVHQRAVADDWAGRGGGWTQLAVRVARSAGDHALERRLRPDDANVLLRARAWPEALELVADDVQKGRVLKELGRTDEAMATWKASDNPVANELVVDLLLEQGKREEAVAAATTPWAKARATGDREAVASLYTQPERGRRLAILALDAGDRPAAVAAYREAGLYTDAAGILDTPEAWRAAIEADPDDPDARVGLARHLAVDDAVPLLDEALAIDACHVEALLARGTCATLRRAWDARPMSADVRARIGGEGPPSCSE